jgi:hypothetical protein
MDNDTIGDYESIFNTPFIADKEYNTELKTNWDYWGDATGKIIIESAMDNSIPYPMHSLIEHKFNAYRVHRG